MYSTVGVRSGRYAQELINQRKFAKVYNLKGSIVAWVCFHRFTCAYHSIVRTTALLPYSVLGYQAEHHPQYLLIGTKDMTCWVHAWFVPIKGRLGCIWQ